MRLLWLYCVLLAFVNAQVINKIDGIEVFGDGPFKGSRDSIAGAQPTNDIKELVRYPALPLSHRTIYRPYLHSEEDRLTHPFTADNIDPALRGDWLFDVVLFEGTALNQLGETYTGPLDTRVVPFLIPYQFAQLTDPCESASAAAAFIPLDFALDRVGNSVFGADVNKQGYVFPVNENFLSLYEGDGFWLCVANYGGLGEHLFTNILYQVVPACDQDNSGVLAPLTHDATYQDTAIGANADLLVRLPTDCSLYPTFDILTTDENFQHNIIEEDIDDDIDADADPFTESLLESFKLRNAERRQRTVCCGSRERQVDANGVLILQKRWGMCINPLTEACCSSVTDNRHTRIDENDGGMGKPYSIFNEKCCFGGDAPLQAGVETQARVVETAVHISYLDSYCPCIISDDPNSDVRPSPATSEDWCGPVDRCCDFFKYPELQPPVGEQRVGKCFDPERESCCDTGDIFDKGTFQCCAINGLQSLNDPCPCAVEADCRVPQVPFLQGNKTCCTQRFPDLDVSTLCSPYLNYPSGNGINEVQTCPGQCIDLRYQSCCNGQACISEYERCCNSTCCNRFTSTCIMGIRPGSPSSQYNNLDFRVPFEVCSEIEALTPYHAVMVYLLPICLLIATYLGLGFSLFFAKRVNALNPLSGYEKLMFLLAILVIIFGWPMYFTPLYKYGIVIVWVGFFTIVAALSGIKLLVLLVIIAQALLLLYVYDPFYGNEILSFAYGRPDRSTGFNGILHSLRSMWDAPLDERFDWKVRPVDLRENIFNGFRCTGYYDGFFRRDPQTEDYDRYDNPYKYTFGFCARDWYSAMVILEGILLFLVVFLFLVTIITHLKNILVKKVLARSYFANPIAVME